jgi:hypothetical protein
MSSSDFDLLLSDPTNLMPGLSDVVSIMFSRAVFDHFDREGELLRSEPVDELVIDRLASLWCRNQLGPEGKLRVAELVIEAHWLLATFSEARLQRLLTAAGLGREPSSKEMPRKPFTAMVEQIAHTAEAWSRSRGFAVAVSRD